MSWSNDLQAIIAMTQAPIAPALSPHLQATLQDDNPGGVDFVLTIGERRIPLEVKYRRRLYPQDAQGLLSFVERSHYNVPFGILVTLAAGMTTLYVTVFIGPLEGVREDERIFPRMSGAVK
jgi:hypothetical protein